MWGQVRSSRRAPSGEYHYAVEFEAGQYPARAALARAVFHGRYPVAGTERTTWAELLRREMGTLSQRFRMRESGPMPVPTAMPPVRLASPSGS
jgi:hypothetical protein